MGRERVAVVGSGVSGLTAAYLLRHGFDVTLFEARPKLGGHADTRDITTPDGTTVPVDTGFIVHNRVTYPHLSRLFAELRVPLCETEMSMSVSCLACGLSYTGGKSGAGLAARTGPGTRGKYVRMLAEIPRFYRAAHALLATSEQSEPTLGEFLMRGRYSRYFIDHFALPLVSAVWSVGEDSSHHYPARYLFVFLRNHGMLSIGAPHKWRTVAGGSRLYVDRIGALLADVRAGVPVRAIRRHADGVEIIDAGDAVHHMDRVVVATHADQALGLLIDPTPQEKEVLGAFSYSRNFMQLHTDGSVLPGGPRLRASWNLLKPACRGGERALVSYDMTRLMRLSEPIGYIVTLNGADRVDRSAVLAESVYEHPVYTPASVAAQRSLPSLTYARTAFAGAYHGWGFHEDGCLSGVQAARAFGAGWP